MQLRKMLIHTEKKNRRNKNNNNNDNDKREKKRISLIAERIQWRRHT